MEGGSSFAAMESAGLVNISVTPTYFDDSLIDEAISDLGTSVDLKSFSREKISKTVFSAKITASKPA